MGKNPIKVRSITIEKRDAEAFMNSLEIAINSLSSEDFSNLYLVVENRNAIAISFDGHWEPFLGFTQGYNPPTNRIYLPYHINFLNKLGKSLKERGQDIPGGRVFLRKFAAFIISNDVESTICTYEWPFEDPVSLARSILNTRRYL